MPILQLALGLVGLLAGAEFAVKGALGVARRLGWPAWLTGLVLLATGTSLPELFVAGFAAPEHPDLGLGTLFGSNVFNSTVVFGALLLVARRPMPAEGVGRLPAVLLVGGSALAFLAFGAAEIPGWAAPALLLGYAVLLISSVRSGTTPRVDEADILPGGVAAAPGRSMAWSLGVMAVGFAILALGSDAFLRGALGASEALGWNEGFVGYLIAAVGTSAPELLTSWNAARHGHSGAVLGNVFGSNAFNLLISGGVVAVLAGAPIDPAHLQPQLVVNFAACLLVALPGLLRLPARIPVRFGRALGVVLLLAWLLASWQVGLA